MRQDAVHDRAGSNGGADQMFYFQRASDYNPPIQCNPALMEQPHWLQSGSPPKHAGLDIGFQIGSVIDGHFRKQALLRDSRAERRKPAPFLREASVSGKPATDAGKRLGQLEAVFGKKHFGGLDSPRCGV